MYLLSTSACLCGRFIFPQDPSSPQILGRRRPHLDKYKSRHSAASLSNSFPHIRSAWTLPHTRLHVQLYSVHCTQVRCMPRMGGGLIDSQLPKTWEVFVSRHFWVHFCPRHRGLGESYVQRVQNLYGKRGGGSQKCLIMGGFWSVPFL